MRISLVHGEDTKKAYEKFRGLIDQSKSRGFEIISIDDIRKIVGQSLFEDKLVFVLQKPSKVKLADWKWLGQTAAKYNSNMLIYYEGSAPVTLTKNLPKDAKIEKFDLPKIIFTFLDSFYPGNSKNCLRLLDELVKTEAIELVFFLTARHMRDLAWIRFGKETLNLPSWRASKLAQQSGKFEPEKLRRIIFEMSEIDIKNKTSESNLKSMLDILIVKHLE